MRKMRTLGLHSWFHASSGAGLAVALIPLKVEMSLFAIFNVDPALVNNYDGPDCCQIESHLGKPSFCTNTEY